MRPIESASPLEAPFASHDSLIKSISASIYGFTKKIGSLDFTSYGCAKKQSTLEEESLLRTFILEFEETTLKGFIATINIGGLGHPALLKGRIFQTIPRCMVEYR